MADTRLPLPVRVGIRDSWDKEDAPLHAAREALEEVLGLPVRIEPEWAQLVNELDKLYDDKKNIVVAVAGCVELWYKVLTQILDEADRAGAEQQQWVETLLERVANSQGRGLRLFLEVTSEAGTSWTDATSSYGAGFVVNIPRRRVVFFEELRPVYHSQILQSFQEKKVPIAERLAAGAGGASAGGEGGGGGGGTTGDDWADVKVDGTITDKAVPAASPAPKISAFMPSANSLPNPDELLRRPPYHLTVLDYGSSTVEVQCSHGPTLEFLSTYLKRWCRVNHNNVNKPPAVDVKLHQSVWVSGVWYDRLTLTTEEQRYNYTYTVNGTIVLALVEGILGYTRLSGEGRIVNYRRDVAFEG